MHQGCQGPFQGSRGKLGFLSRQHSGKGSHLELRGESLGFFRVVAGNLGFLSSYDRDLRNPLVGPKENPMSMRVAGTSRDSSAVAAGAEVLIWSSGWKLRFPLNSRHGSQHSSGVSTEETGLVSCGVTQVCSPLELEKQCQASCRVDIGIGDFL